MAVLSGIVIIAPSLTPVFVLVPGL